MGALISQQISFLRIVFIVLTLSQVAWAQAAAKVDAKPAAVATVNINTASAEDLAKGLKGVGLSKAKAIVEYRKSHGKFVVVEQLAEVKGIGKATVEKNKSVIKLQ